MTGQIPTAKDSRADGSPGRRSAAGLDAFVDPGTVPERLAGGMTWTEGPVWLPMRMW